MKEVHNSQVTVTHAPKFQGKFWMFSCRFMQSFNVPTRMIWGFPTPSVLYTKLWKFLPFKNHSFTRKFGHSYVCASRSPCQAPLGTQKASFFFVSPKYIVYPSAHRTGVRHRGKLAAVLCILAVDNFSESELQKGKGSLTTGLFSQLPASWGWWESVLLALVGAHPSHLSCTASSTLQNFVLLGLAEEVLGHEA